MSTTLGLEAGLSAACAFVRGCETNKAIAAITLDRLIQEQLEFIEGMADQSTTRSNRPSRLVQLDTLEKNLSAAVQTLSSPETP